MSLTKSCLVNDTYYRIVVNFWGRKLSQIGFCRKNFGGLLAFATPKDITPQISQTKPQNSWKFSPSKVYHYTVIASHVSYAKAPPHLTTILLTVAHRSQLMSASCIDAFFCSLFCCSHCATVGRGLIPISPIRLDSLSFSTRAWCSWWSISSFTSCNKSGRGCRCVEQDRCMGGITIIASQIPESTFKLP